MGQKLTSDSFNLLDCTIRDGGYYTNWDFNEALIEQYLETMRVSGIDALEIGYRNPPVEEYKGEYFYTPVERIRWIKERFDGELAVLIDVKNVDETSIANLIQPLSGLIELIRFAVHPDKLSNARKLAACAKEIGFKVALNVMYFSTWWDNDSVIYQLIQARQFADYIYLVDSFGASYPNQVYTAVEKLASAGVPVGFHGHNNLELALANTLEAKRAGAKIIDSTITGMGRGAGNLKTELLLAAMYGKTQQPSQLKVLSDLVERFEELRATYGWGTSLPYMVAGAWSFPQGKVMDWITTRYYPLQEVVTGLGEIVQNSEPAQYEIFKFETPYAECLIIGGGESVELHQRAIERLLSERPEMLVVFASSRHYMRFKSIPNKQVVVIVGNESERLRSQLNSWDDFSGICVIPCPPRELPEIIPHELKSKVREMTFPKIFDAMSSHTSVAIEICALAQAKSIFVCGYDGYIENHFSGKTRAIHLENESLFNQANLSGLSLKSVTPTSYSHLLKSSIYALHS